MILKLVSEGDWIRLDGIIEPGFISLLKLAMGSGSYHKFDLPRMKWLIHYTKIEELKDAASHFYDSVDVTGFTKQSKANRVASTLRQAYQSLYVTEDAPLEVVKASYQVLTHKYHPDQAKDGGNAVKLREVMEAYKLVRKNFSS